METIVIDFSHININNININNTKVTPIKSFMFSKIILPEIKYKYTVIKTVPLDSELHSQR